MSRQAVYKWESNKEYPDIDKLIKISDTFGVTIDELIKKDESLQKKISIDEDESFEEFSDPRFYLGVILGTFIFDGTLSNILTSTGLFTILFLTDVIKSIKSLF
ncbi:hypothetical protein GCM10011409_39670 [Lentibacillus populi]|uniref:HTH cro/C1-type domain-containing protein n=1 Tax=Lentibacillus populi TaxID=1827502 RepID=A0A9W5U1F6_9BACI|nr:MULTISPECIES: helix-turn-helix transcriptional regulator [Bacillaceae]GGB58228.1 hypothetical protein GCM10011409_39670 [Lentibacillus populi]